MSTEVVGAVAALLEERHGLRFDGAGKQRLARGVRETARWAGTVPEALARRLATDAAAERDLLDRVTLQESSWFRDEAAWTALRDVVLPAALARDPALEVWSAGCANGQEAWSLAMLLDELGAARARVVASDVSAAAVVRAAAGRYDDRELRGLSAERRALHGRPTPGGWEVGPSLRARVRFTRHNLATDPPPVAASRCGLVLSRYVLIYLTPEGSARFLDHVRTTLGPDGVLLVGAAETLWHLSSGFTAEPVGRSFVYRPRAREVARGQGKVAEASSPLRPPAPAPSPAAPAPPPPPRRGSRFRQGRAPSPRERPPAPPPAPDPAFLLRRGEEALARGDHGSAVAAFRGAAFLAPADPLAHLRLGLALDAQGDPGAERAFRAARAALDAGKTPSAGADPAELERILASRLGPR
jgi:chemotaxis protein methyltransferase CheR